MILFLLEGNVLSKLEDLLEPSESIIWKGKPDIIAFMLPAFGGVFFALMFLGIASVWLLVGVPILQSPMVIAIPAAIILIVVPPYWQYKQYPFVGYIITDKKLIAKKGKYDNLTWTLKLEEIKDVLVKGGILYPITSRYPYEPKKYANIKRAGITLKKVYNVAEQKYEEITPPELYRIDKHRPKIEGLTEPYKVQEILKNAIDKYANSRFKFPST